MGSLQSTLQRALPIVATAYGEQFGVNVVLSGRDAYTDGKTIVVPMLDNMVELKDVLFGYLAHEAAHVRDTDFSAMASCKNEVEKSFLNVIEDYRIEKLIEEVFPGTRQTLDVSWTYMADQGWTEVATSDMNEAGQLQMFLLHYVMAEGLGREASVSMLETSRKVVEQTFPPGFFVRFDVLMAKRLPGLSNTADCLKLARAVLKALKDAEEEERQKQEQQQQSQGQSAQSGDQGQGADGSSQGDSQSGKDSPCGDGSRSEGGSDGSQSQDSSGSDGAKGDAANANGSAGGDADSSDGKDSKGSSTSPGSDSSQSDKQQSSSGSSPDQTGGSGDKPTLHDRIVKETDLVQDPMATLKQQLKDSAEESNKEEGNFQLAASTVGDPVGNEGDGSTLTQGVLASSAIRARLQGLLQAQTRQKQWLHTSGKRMDGKRLTRLAAGDTRIFLQKDEMKRPDTAVHVLLDTSGSMDSRQAVANQATVSLALAASSFPQCDIAVSMFPGRGGAVSPIIARGQPIRPNMAKFAVTSSGGTPLAEAMLYAARELATANRQRKVLIIITDGAPRSGGAVHYMNRVLEPHVDTYAVGIGTHAVSNYFKQWTVISDVKELQSALFQIAGRFLDLH